MSGVEVVGILLGAFPLAISAMEHWREMCKTTKSWINYKQEWHECLEDIRDEELDFRIHLNLLLLPMVRDDVILEDNLEIMLVDLRSNLWKLPNVEEALKARLGQCYARYFQIAQNLQELISKLLDMIGFNNNDLRSKLEAPAASQKSKSKATLTLKALNHMLATSLEYRAQQIMFPFDEIAREALLGKIHSKIERLDSLLRKGSQVVALQRSIAKKGMSRTMWEYSQHAKNVFNLLVKVLGCDCLEQHSAHLWLRHRAPAEFVLSFMLHWANNSIQNNTRPAWKSRYLQIIYSKVLPAQVAAPLAIQSDGKPALPSFHSIGKTDQARKLRKPRPGESISRSNSRNPPSRPHTPQPEPIQTVGQPLAPPVALTKLCAQLTQHGSRLPRNWILGEVRQGDKYMLSLEPPASPKVAFGGASLHDILQDPEKQIPDSIARMCLALVIASAQLQLKPTPWAQKQWQSTDVFFSESTVNLGDPCVDNERDLQGLDRPYIDTTFSTATTNGGPAQLLWERSFSSLGILLLELICGCCLEDHKYWRRREFAGQEANVPFRLLVARLWADEVKTDAVPELSEGVKWCLNDSPNTVSNDQWQRDFAQKVIIPIEKSRDWLKERRYGAGTS